MRRFFALLTLTAGVFAAPTAAHADVITDGSGGILSGNQVIAPISVNVDVSDVAVAILGHALS